MEKPKQKWCHIWGSSIFYRFPCMDERKTIIVGKSPNMDTKWKISKFCIYSVIWEHSISLSFHVKQVERWIQSSLYFHIVQSGNIKMVHSLFPFSTLCYHPFSRTIIPFPFSCTIIPFPFSTLCYHPPVADLWIISFMELVNCHYCHFMNVAHQKAKSENYTHICYFNFWS